MLRPLPDGRAPGRQARRRRSPSGREPAGSAAFQDRARTSKAPGRSKPTASASPLGAQEPTAFAFPRPFLFGFALVVELLAARQRQLDLGAALGVEVELEWHHRHALSLDSGGELVDLAAVQQELARALGLVVEAARLQIFRNIGVIEPQVSFARSRVRLADARLALPQRLHLCAGERQPGLDHVTDLIVEAGLAVVGHDFEVRIGFGRHAGPRSAGFIIYQVRRERRRAHAKPPAIALRISDRGANRRPPPMLPPGTEIPPIALGVPLSPREASRGTGVSL